MAVSLDQCDFAREEESVLLVNLPSLYLRGFGASER